MTIKDYKSATKKLNRFVHESKMFRDPEYRRSYEIRQNIKRTLRNQFWFGNVLDRIGNKKTADGLFAVMHHEANWGSMIPMDENYSRMYRIGIDPVVKKTLDRLK